MHYVTIDSVFSSGQFIYVLLTLLACLTCSVSSVSFLFLLTAVLVRLQSVHGQNVAVS